MSGSPKIDQQISAVDGVRTSQDIPVEHSSEEFAPKDIHHYVGASLLYKQNSLSHYYGYQMPTSSCYDQYHANLRPHGSLPGPLRNRLKGPITIFPWQQQEFSTCYRNKPTNQHTGLTDLQKRALEVTGFPLINFNANNNTKSTQIYQNNLQQNISLQQEGTTHFNYDTLQQDSQRSQISGLPWTTTLDNIPDSLKTKLKEKLNKRQKMKQAKLELPSTSAAAGKWYKLPEQETEKNNCRSCTCCAVCCDECHQQQLASGTTTWEQLLPMNSDDIYLR